MEFKPSPPNTYPDARNKRCNRFPKRTADQLLLMCRCGGFAQFFHLRDRLLDSLTQHGVVYTDVSSSLRNT